MIIWKGYGFLVLVIAIVIGAGVSFIFEKIGSSKDLGAAIGAIISAAVIWIVGNKLNSPAKDRIVIDKQSGKEIVIKTVNSLFFIRMQYWSFIVGGIGVVMLVDFLIHGKSSF